MVKEFKHRIMIVEDSDTQRLQLQTVLEKQRYEVIPASNGREALEKLEQIHDVDILLTDVNMPEMDGYTLSKTLKESERWKDIPIILLTVLAGADDIIRALECRVDHYITKPFRDDTLFSRIETLISKHGQVRDPGESNAAPLDYIFDRKHYKISGGRSQILNLMLSIYENSVRDNEELEKLNNELLSTRDALENLNYGLESEVERRTDELKKTKEKYEAIVKALPDPLCIIDRDGLILEHYEPASGGDDSPLSLISPKKNIYELLPQSVCRRFKEKIKTVIERQSVETYEFELKNNSSTYYYEVRINYVSDDRLLLIRRDRTEYKKLEYQLVQSQKMEAIGKLAGGVAHDFNNILTVINGTAQLIEETLPEGDPLRAELTEIIKSGDSAAALTRQLLAFSRKQIIAPKIISIDDTVSHLTKMLGRLIGEDIHLSLDLSSSTETVRFDPGQIEQVLMNLTVNARDSMPAGGILHIRTAVFEAEKNINFQHFDILAGRYIEISVRDSGTGIATDIQDKMFDPFFTTKEAGHGTGMGLSTVYGIIKQHGGYILCESKPGEGTTFRIFIPVTNHAGETVEDKPAGMSLVKEVKPATEPARRRTVLIVEDGKKVQLIARKALEKAGYKVLTADNVDEAVEIFNRGVEKPDLVFTDVVMPGKSGSELIKFIGSNHPEVKCLLTSGYTDDHLVRYGVSTGNFAFLSKPYKPSNLQSKVNELLSG